MSSTINSSSGRDWFFAHGPEQLGPVDERSLHELIVSGEVERNTLVWTAGMSAWTAAGSVEELASIFALLQAPAASQETPSALENEQQAPFDANATIDAAPSSQSYVDESRITSQNISNQSRPESAQSIGEQPSPYAAANAAPPTEQGKLRYRNSDASSTQYSYAGFWIRLLAWAIDLTILFLIGLLLSCVINIGAIFVSTIIAWLYFALFDSSSARGTLGKQLFGLKVSDTSGNKITFLRASLRFAGRLLNTCILGLGYLLIVFTERKQGLHDMIAQTIVLRRA